MPSAHDNHTIMRLAVAADVSFPTAADYLAGRRPPTVRTRRITARLERAASELGLMPIAPAPPSTTDAARAA